MYELFTSFMYILAQPLRPKKTRIIIFYLSKNFQAVDTFGAFCWKGLYDFLASISSIIGQNLGSCFFFAIFCVEHSSWLGEMVSRFILFFCWHLQNKMYLIFQRAKPKQKHNKKKSPRLKPRKNSPDRWAGLEMVEEITLEELTATSRPMYGRPSWLEESRFFQRDRIRMTTNFYGSFVFV